MKLVIEFETDNSAFYNEDDTEDVSYVHELIQRAINRMIQEGESFGELSDYNGNKVGHFKIDY